MHVSPVLENPSVRSTKRLIPLLCIFATLGCDANSQQTRDDESASPKFIQESGQRSAIIVYSTQPENRVPPLAIGSVGEFISSLNSGDPQKRGFCIQATLEYPWGPTKKKSEQWFSPATYDGESFHATLKHHFDKHAGKVGDRVVISKDHVIDWSFLDGEQIVRATSERSTSPKLIVPVLERDGTRKLRLGQVEKEVAWFVIRVPESLLQEPSFWATLPCMQETVCAEVGCLTTIEWHEYDEESRSTFVSDGIAFHYSARGLCVVGPGEGAVSLVHWKFNNEMEQANNQVFQSGSLFVFCFGQPLEMQGLNLGGIPASDIPSEHEKLIGIIEIQTESKK